MICGDPIHGDQGAGVINESLRHFLNSVWMLVGLTIVGTLGLMLTGDRGIFEALYLTVIILTTVGMEAPTTQADRVWSLLLMVGGIGTVLYATGQLVSFVVEGHLKQMIGRRKVTERIKKLNRHFIVIGYGRMGQALCATLAFKEKPFVVIESDAKRLRAAEERGCLCIEGDAMQESILHEAGLSRAAGLVTCLPHDADNVLISLTARSLHPELHITSRCDEAETEPKLRRAGADRVICPAVMGAARASNQLLNPQVDDMLELDGHWPDLELSRVSLSRFPGFAQVPLESVNSLIGTQSRVVAVIQADGTRLLHPPLSTIVTAKDQLIIIGGTGCVNKMLRALTRIKAA